MGENEDLVSGLMVTAEKKNYVGQVTWVDNTMLEAHRLCPRKYYYRHHRALIPKGWQKVSSALRFGELMHLAWGELWRTNGDVKCAIKEFLRDFDITGDAKRTSERGVDILIKYARLRQGMMRDYKVLGIEEVVEMNVGGRTYRGKLDLQLEGPDGLVYGMDWKTTSMGGSLPGQAYRHARQFKGYARMIKLKYGKNASDEFLVDLVQIFPKETQFSIVRVEVNDEWLLEWEREIGMEIRAIKDKEEFGLWPMSAPHACMSFNRLCEYSSLCEQPLAIRERLMEIEFDLEPWEVTVEKMREI